MKMLVFSLQNEVEALQEVKFICVFHSFTLPLVYSVAFN